MSEPGRGEPAFSDGGGGRVACPDAMALAAFADGRLGPGERDAIEAHLAACGDCLDLVLGASAAIEPVRAEVVARAQALAGVRAAREPGRMRIGARWVAAAAAAIVVCAGAFRLGSASAAAPAPAERVVADATFGMLAPDADDAVAFDAYAIALLSEGKR
jgi:anti-sigma factor ChrR (cupin superfamily)